VAALHAQNVIHRDLKTKNVLLTASLVAKVADVGIAAVHSQGYLTAGAGHMVGTLAWSAPELLLNYRCSDKVDIYSLGVVLWEIATGQVPTRGFTAPPEPSERCPAELAELIRQCTQVKPNDRPTAREVFSTLLKIPPLMPPRP
jgi:serine/threonine protein kinase